MDTQLSEQQNEVLLIASEECAEVIQSISKIFRFGIDTEWHGKINRDHLAEELGDLQCMINLCCIVGIVSNKEVDTAAVGKEAKLRKWSTIINPIIDETGATSWHLNGKRHREDGPAIEDADGSKQWYLNGKLHTEEEFNSLCPKRT